MLLVWYFKIRKPYMPPKIICPDARIYVPTRRILKKTAIAIMIPSEEDILASRVLSQSLDEVCSKADKVALIIKGKVSKRGICVLKQLGWKVKEVDAIRPKSFDGVYMEQYTKLKLWDMTEYSRVVYISLDMIVKRNFDHLFEIPTEYGAISDWFNTGTEKSLSASFMIVQPSQIRYQHMLELYESGAVDYDRKTFEEGFLNSYYTCSVWKIPQDISGNVSLLEVNGTIWQQLQSRFVVYHFTVSKPFKPSCEKCLSLTYKPICDMYRKFMNETIQAQENLLLPCEATVQ